MAHSAIVHATKQWTCHRHGIQKPLCFIVLKPRGRHNLPARCFLRKNCREKFHLPPANAGATRSGILHHPVIDLAKP
jgi:hypothetical protein